MGVALNWRGEKLIDTLFVSVDCWAYDGAIKEEETVSEALTLWFEQHKLPASLQPPVWNHIFINL